MYVFAKRGNSRTFSRRSIHGQVAHEIGQRILRGDFVPGAVLPNEAAFSIELKISRTALREAIKVLAAKGLVESRPKTGTRVRPRDQWNMLDPDVLAWSFSVGDTERHALNLTELRRILEPAAAALAAERAGPEDIARITEAYDQMAAAGEDVEAAIGPDLRFHQAILLATGNEFMAPMGFVIESALAASFKLSSSFPGARTNSLPRHHAVLERIRERDAVGAHTAMLRLLQETRDDIERVLSEQAVLGAAPRTARSNKTRSPADG
jgi:DNA-binding FadR family transcriptional regulator